MKNMSGAAAIKAGLITEEDWLAAKTYPWTWVWLKNGLRIRERPWNGIDIEERQSGEDPDA